MELTDTESRIIKDNLKIHAVEAEYYDILHSELNNAYILKVLDNNIRFVIDHVSAPLSSHVLDLGAGTGYLTIPFLQKGFFVNAVDMSSEMLEVCRKRTNKLKLEHRAQFFISEAGQFLQDSKDKKFSIIIISSFLHHIYDYSKILRELDNHLLPGGIIFIAWEPTSQYYNKFSLLAKIVDFIDNKFFKIYIKKHNIYITDMDYKYSDYHVNISKGCNPYDIIKDFKARHYSILKFENFSGLAKSAFAAKIHNYLKLSLDHFRLIMKKPIENIQDK